MCGGVIYFNGEYEKRVFFPEMTARIPVKSKQGGYVLLPWGRRREQDGKLPMGGWARLDSVYAGRWDRWFPIPVKLPLLQFMEKDIEGNSHWHTLTKGQWVQGLIAKERYEQRVYVVTVEPEQSDAIYHRWPRILSG
ncbi:MAG: hypothetical protein KAQ67_10080 [Gammaproteobacteria bacterium]|nr:hypothetical protein [Gammaproteobacteria bacterium]